MASESENLLKAGRTSVKIAVAFLLMQLAISCTVSYKFTGASISPQVKTISIQYFQNRASLVQPALSQGLTDALIDKCKAQTKLTFVNSNSSVIGDVNFEGEITDYNTKPLTVSADAKAAMNRFTISVKVKFTNAIETNYNYEKTFSRYQDYDSNRNLSDVEGTLVELIVEQLVEDIFNEAFVNW